MKKLLSLALAFLFIPVFVHADDVPEVSDPSISILRDEAGRVAGYAMSSAILFSKMSNDLGEAGKQTLDQFFQAISKTPATMALEIYGYSDASGSDQVNKVVTEARALRVFHYLVTIGLAKERVNEVKGLGPVEFVADNDSELGREQNRRVEIHIAGRVVKRTKVFKTAASTPVPTPPPTPTPKPTPTPDPGRFGLGIGYPDVRARLQLIKGLDLEVKYAAGFESETVGESAISGRLYFQPMQFGPLTIDLGAEVGHLSFSNVDAITGDGIFAEPFFGVEYPFAHHRFAVAIDFGPAWINLNSAGETTSFTTWTLNTSFYCWVW